MLRSKVLPDGSFESNSYSSPDSVNALKWSDLEQDEAAAVYAYYKGLIAFRMAHPVLRLPDEASVKACVVPVTEGLDSNVVAFRIHGNVEGETAEEMFVVFNAREEATPVTLPAGTWGVCVNDTTAGTEILETVSGTVQVAPISALVLIRTGAEEVPQATGPVQSSEPVQGSETETSAPSRTGLYAGIAAAAAAAVATAAVVITKKRKK